MTGVLVSFERVGGCVAAGLGVSVGKGLSVAVAVWGTAARQPDISRTVQNIVIRSSHFLIIAFIDCTAGQPE